MIEAGRTCDQNRKGRGALNILTREPTVRRPLGRPKGRCKYNIRTNLREILIDVNVCSLNDLAQSCSE